MARVMRITILLRHQSLYDRISAADWKVALRQCLQGSGVTNAAAPTPTSSFAVLYQVHLVHDAQDIPSVSAVSKPPGMRQKSTTGGQLKCGRQEFDTHTPSRYRRLFLKSSTDGRSTAWHTMRSMRMKTVVRIAQNHSQGCRTGWPISRWISLIQPMNRTTARTLDGSAQRVIVKRVAWPLLCGPKNKQIGIIGKSNMTNLKSVQ